MSISSVLRPDTKNEAWSQIYVNGITAQGLVADSVLLGVAPDQYILPTNTPTLGDTIMVIGPGETAFKNLRRITVNFGGNCNANPSFPVASGYADLAGLGVLSYRTNIPMPFACTARNLTISSRVGNTTTGWNLLKNGVIFHSFTFPANNVYNVPVTLNYAAGDIMAMSHTGVGTTPNESNIVVFITEQD